MCIFQNERVIPTPLDKEQLKVWHSFTCLKEAEI